MEHDEEAGGKTPRGLASVAMRDVRRVRRLISDAQEGEPISQEAGLLVQVANALALLDLAAAVRESKAAD